MNVLYPEVDDRSDEDGICGIVETASWLSGYTTQLVNESTSYDWFNDHFEYTDGEYAIRTHYLW